MSGRAQRRRRVEARALDRAVQAKIDASRATCLCTPRYRSLVEDGELVIEIHHAALCPAGDLDVRLDTP